MCGTCRCCKSLKWTTMRSFDPSKSCYCSPSLSSFVMSMLLQYATNHLQRSECPGGVNMCVCFTSACRRRDTTRAVPLHDPRSCHCGPAYFQAGRCHRLRQVLCSVFLSAVQQTGGSSDSHAHIASIVQFLYHCTHWRSVRVARHAGTAPRGCGCGPCVAAQAWAWLRVGASRAVPGHRAGEHNRLPTTCLLVVCCLTEPPPSSSSGSVLLHNHCQHCCGAGYHLPPRPHQSPGRE